MVDFKDLMDSLKDRVTNFISYDANASDTEIKSKKRNIIIAGSSCLLVFLLIFIMVFLSFKTGQPMDLQDRDDVIYFHVSKGMSSAEIGKELEQKGVINSTAKFWLATKLNGADARFKVGTFALTRNMSASDALSVLLYGKTVPLRVTIPEGYGVKEIAKRLDEYGICSEKDFLRAARNYAPYDYMEEHKDTIYRVEGFLFPDTYEFAGNATAEDIMKRMIDEFDDQLTPAMRRRAAERHISIYELVNMASLIEKEARYEEDMPIISQVLWKRLNISMPLQSDATLQYVMDEIKEDVSIADTKIDSPYNSYQHYGLPPGPIANPGIKAIEAALNPASTDYLYFVADREGKNYYSTTYSDHLAIVSEVR